MSRKSVFEDREIGGLTCDSRRVEPGFLFAALPGTTTDGRRFIGDALARGAAAVLAPEGTDGAVTGGRVPLITDPNPRRRYALAAAGFFGRQPATVAAVTGTNGKTSVVSFLRQIWAFSGWRAASAGTLGIEYSGPDGDRLPEPPEGFDLTTPDPVDLHRCLAAICADGVDHLAIEASSHGLDQYRLDGMRPSAVGFTNLTRDHLDYHGSTEAYLAAKLRLFEELAPDGTTAVVNADDAYGETFVAAARRRNLPVLTYGAAGEALTLERVTADAEGQLIEMTMYDERASLRIPLAGPFQVANALSAAGLALATGSRPQQVLEALPHLKGVRGRMELVGARGNGAAVYVDYAHTPDALKNALEALRPHTRGGLHVVFGCGGDRDAGKRPEMGAIAADLADVVVVTDDNPRTENAAAIRGEIMAAALGADEIAPRERAIEAAVAALAEGDLLLVAGKGHETGQIVGDGVLPFDDADVARRALEKNR